MSKEKDDSSKKGEGEVSHKYTLEDYLDLEEKLKAAGDQKEGDSGTKEEVEKIRLEPKVERFKDQLELSFEMRGIHEIVKAGNYPDSKEINTKDLFFTPTKIEDGVRTTAEGEIIRTARGLRMGTSGELLKLSGGGWSELRDTSQLFNYLNRVKSF